jgi:hypothetical protein
VGGSAHYLIPHARRAAIARQAAEHDQYGLAHALARDPSLVSSLVHGGVGAVVGAGVGTMVGLAVWPAHVGAFTLAAGGALGMLAAQHGQQAGDRVAEQLGMQAAEPTKLEIVGATVHDALTTSTGSMTVDALIGGAVGYALAPKLAWVLAGALLGGVGGIAGILVLAGAHIVSAR